MCKILPRIKQLAEHEGITIGALERIIGASKGVLSRAISNGTDIQSKWLQAIVENYPQYSAQWLLTGVGNMMSTSNGIPSHLVETDPTKGKNYIPPTAPIEAPPSQAASDSSLVTNLVTTIQKQAEEIGRLKERIAQLEREKNVGEESFQDAPRELSKSTVDL
nr:MAG TPA: structural protein [Caudoviricetes sp.]